MKTKPSLTFWEVFGRTLFAIGIILGVHADTAWLGFSAMAFIIIGAVEGWRR